MEPIREHIRLLSIFHYILGGIGCLFSFFPVIHLILGLFFLNADIPEKTSDPDAEVIARFMGILFTVIPIIIIVLGLTFSICTIKAGKYLSEYSNHTFCLVIAGILCIVFPLGTVLGVFTLVIINKPEARELFGLPTLSSSDSGPAVS